MKNSSRIAMAVVVLALIACSRGGVGGLREPVSTATAAPRLPLYGELAPGTYRMDFITFTLPAGWNVTNKVPVKPDANPPTGMAFNTWRIASVYSDPCHWRTTRALIGPTVNDLVAAFVAQKRGSTVAPVNVTVDGFRGKQIDLEVPLDIKFGDCDRGEYHSWKDADGGEQYNQGPGQHDLLQILDVNGRTLVIKESFYPDNTPADRAELQAIVKSIKITPPNP